MIFKDGKTCISLNSEFEEEFKRLVTQVTKKTLEWDFQPSCCCGELQRNRDNAEYYKLRGHFQLCKKAPEKALIYLREAQKLDNTYLDDYGMALIAVRQSRQDPALEDILASEAPPQKTLYYPGKDGFIHDYLQVIGRQDEVYERLRKQLQDLENSGKVQYWTCPVRKCVHELPLHTNENLSECSVNAPIELPGDEVVRKVKGESNSGRVLSTPKIVATNSVEPKPSFKDRLRFWL